MRQESRVRALILMLTAASVPLPTPAQTAPPANEELTEVVVTGIRRSIEAAQEVKREAPSVVEAITAEDLGKFSDAAISDALQRVPGVNIERNVRGYEGGDGVTIRGLGPDFLLSTINGRELMGIPAFFGAGGRNVDYGAIPPEILAGVLVYKSPTAEIIESGLGGEVDLRTLRPLDYQPRGGGKYFGSASLIGTYDPKSDEVEPRIGGVLGGKFFEDTLGVYISALRSTDRTLQDMAQMYPGTHDVLIDDGNGNVTTYEAINTLEGYSNLNSERVYDKRSVSAGVQWKPNGNLDINGDFIYNEFVTDMFNFGSDYIGGYSYTDPGTATQTFLPGGAIIRGKQLVYADSSLAVGGSDPYQQAGYTHVVNTNRFQNVGLNAAWTSDDERLRVSADASHGNNDYLMDWKGPYATNGALGGVESVYDARGDKPILTFNGPTASDMSQASSYGDFGFFGFQQFFRGERNAFKLDFAGKLNEHFTVKTGARYAQTNSIFILMFSPGNSQAVDPTGFFNGKTDNLPFYPVGVPQVSEAGFCAANPVACNFNNKGRGSFTGAFPTRLEGSPDDLGLFIGGASWNVKEKNLGLYTQLDMSGNLFGIKASGNAGVRAVRMTEIGQAYQGRQYRVAVTLQQDPDRADETVLFQAETEYWEYLPSLNMTLQPRDNLNLRAGVARTMSLATLNQLAPNGTATFYTPNNDGATQAPLYQAGNIGLKPTMSWNYDLTGEYYTSYGGSYIASLFYKDVKDLVTPLSASGVTVPGYGDILFDVVGNINADKGRAYGFELGTNQPLTFLPAPWDGLGVQANYTYVDTKVKVASEPEPTPFPGSSKHNVNTTVYYEKYNWTVRLAGNYRSDYLAGLSGNQNSRYAKEQFSLDASLTRKFSQNFDVILTGSNLTSESVTNWLGTGHQFQYYFDRPRTFSLAVRASF